MGKQWNSKNKNSKVSKSKQSETRNNATFLSVSGKKKTLQTTFFFSKKVRTLIFLCIFFVYFVGDFFWNFNLSSMIIKTNHGCPWIMDFLQPIHPSPWRKDLNQRQVFKYEPFVFCYFVLSMCSSLFEMSDHSVSVRNVLRLLDTWRRSVFFVYRVWCWFHHSSVLWCHEV